MDIKTNEYQELAYRTAKQFGDIKLDLIHAAIGAGSEVGELADAALVEGNYIEELGDIAWYIALGATVVGVKFDDLWNDSDARGSFFADVAQKTVWCDEDDAMLILSSAVGDFQTVVKGIFCYGKDVEFGVLQVKIKIALYSLILTAGALHVDLSDIAVHNIEKLKKRYPDKYTDVSAITRADKVEGGS